ncbi:MAG: hypothetical protein KDN19_09795, partial [Verrucomicrobiae bacterium]|nr:hypothetical protein [Verrucomicrobiae bacterium]
MNHPQRFQILLALIACLSVGEPGIAEDKPAKESSRGSDWKWQEAPLACFDADLDKAEILRVTNLKKDGTGSLRAALEAEVEGPRLIVFEVGGVIDLEGRGLRIQSDHTWIAGQTGPEPGITVIRGGIREEASHVVLQHLRVRPGDGGDLPDEGWEPDGLTTLGSVHDVLVEHCSMTWSIDENLSASSYGAPDGQGARRITFRRNIIAEGLDEATHEKGGHSKGTLVHDATHEVAIVGNLYAGNVERNPVFKLDTSGVVVNCVMACNGQRAIHASVPEADYPGKPARL